MSLIKWASVVLVACVSCSSPYTLTASLNNSRWFGTGQMTEIHTQENQTCLVDRFSLNVRTDLPFAKSKDEVVKKVTGCKSNCDATQWLGLYNIPLEKGMHDLTQPDTCLPHSVAKSSQSFAVGIASLNIVKEGTGYQFSLGDKGWVRITKLNRTTGLIRGRFDLTLSDSKEKSIHFKRGRFGGKLLQQ